MNFPRGVKDALQAESHLASLAFVDPKRVAHVGFSWGGMVGLLAASKRWREALSDRPFSAIAAVYPGCYPIKLPDGRSFELLNEDLEAKLLVLMGGQDTETPPADCLERLEKAKAAGAAVQWHVFESATHCWDCENLDGLSKTSYIGTSVRYAYDRKVTEESVRRLFDFLAQALAARP